MEHTLYEWFAASVAEFGDRPALEVGEERLTYRELHGLAERIAADLVAARRGVPARVGLLAGRDALTYAGYLAVQRLGAAVVPLSPSAPAARNAMIVRAAGLDLVLAGTTPSGPGTPSWPVPVVPLRRTAPPTARLRLPRRRVDDTDALAYVLFTSGSTGTPKGVPIRHGNVSPYLAHVIARYGLGPGCRVSQTFDLTFDLSVFDMFATWGSGATLVVPTRRDLMVPVRWVADRKLTHWFSVPSLVSFARRMRTLRPGRMPGLRWSLFCGEPLTLQQAGAWATAAPHSTLANLYGPTELTISCAEYTLPADPARWPRPANGTVPIGSVHPGLEHLVLDAGGRPAGEGELVVRGAQRFPGYLDADSDKGRFLSYDGPATNAAPYTGDGPLTDDHWYRTGDRVRREGGRLVHLGRLDQQIKLHGYRIELGEIEAALRDQPGVRDAVAVAVARPGDEIALEAVCTGTDLVAEAIRSGLEARLPAYMVPRVTSVVDELPLNANGKIDRQAVITALEGRRSAARRPVTPHG
ncbi:AMP-binding protein [Streptomyces uncialis]|uniref:AMP-binding protein n=1 Tax=Streptomyces uncialis TaxID=1048205 RepID=UPI0033E94A27